MEVGPDTTNLPALTAGASATIAATGKIAHGTGSALFQLRAYIDEASVGDSEAKLRFVHASPGTPNVDVGIGGGLLFTPVFTNIAMIARRRLIDRRRTRRRRPTTENISEVPSIADGASGPDVSAEANQAARALAQLRPEQRQVLVLQSQGLSHAEISAQIGMPLGTVKAHARRGLISIRAALLGVDQGDVQ